MTGCNGISPKSEKISSRRAQSDEAAASREEDADAVILLQTPCWGEKNKDTKTASVAAVSSLLFGFRYAASVCLSGSTLMWLLNKHSLLKVSLIRLMQCVSMRSVAAGMWMFSQ